MRNIKQYIQHSAAFAVLLTTVATPIMLAQQAAPATNIPATAVQPARTNAPARGIQASMFTSPEVLSDRRVAFRILAPDAKSVKLNAGDITNLGQKNQLNKGTNGVWELITDEVAPGAFRYTFTVDGITVIDPRNPATSESNNNTWSLVTVPGADFVDTKDVPHGAVAAITYKSSALRKFRRMHIYTPPGYELGEGKFPVFYLLHGSSDSDNSWSSVGRAGFIMDNLIAAKKAKPMIVVMPAGHTRSSGMSRPAGGSATQPPADEFTEDFVKDIMPYVEANYRVVKERQSRAIAGLSMGGNQTLNIAIPHLDQFAYIGVYSSGLFGGSRNSTNNPTEAWEQQHLDVLDNPALKNGLKLLWFSTGKDDFLVNTSRATVDLFKKHGFTTIYNETEGAHTWMNWRNYLNEFAPQLFQ